MLILILVIAGFSLLILGHEAGHFFVAKFFNLKIDEFGFGFPPKIWGWKPKGKGEKDGIPRSARDKQGETLRQTQGETEYSFNWLPFGGFVRIAGENDRISGETGKLQDLPEEEKKRYFLFQLPWKRAVIVLAGVIINFVIGWFLFSLVFMIGTPPVLLISGVQPNSPAEKIGIAAGDIIKGYSNSGEFIDFVNENRGKEISLTVMRDSGELSFNVTPRIQTEENKGAIGVYLQEGGVPKLGFLSSFWEGLKQTLEVARLTLFTFYVLLRDLIFKGSLVSGVVGPVGLVSVAQKFGGMGLIYLIQLFGLISVNLAVINLIPFPALDGGRFFMILIEKIKGSPIPIKAEAIINGVGFAFLIALMVLITGRDIIQLF